MNVEERFFGDLRRRECGSYGMAWRMVSKIGGRRRRRVRRVGVASILILEMERVSRGRVTVQNRKISWMDREVSVKRWNVPCENKERYLQKSGMSCVRVQRNFISRPNRRCDSSQSTQRPNCFSSHKGLLRVFNESFKCYMKKKTAKKWFSLSAENSFTMMQVLKHSVDPAENVSWFWFLSQHEPVKPFYVVCVWHYVGFL